MNHLPYIAIVKLIEVFANKYYLLLAQEYIILFSNNPIILYNV
jgi:hypothetical protein